MAERFGGRPRLMPGEISRRELEVLRLFAYGFTRRQAADALFIGVRTVDDHCRNIYARLDLHRGRLHNRDDAVRWAVAHGYLDPTVGVEDRGFTSGARVV